MGEAGRFKNKCPVCALPDELLVQVDILLATPQKKLVDELFPGIAEEDIPDNARRWSSVRHAQEWLQEREHKVSQDALRVHFDKHLPIVPASRQAIAETGRLATGDPAPSQPEPYLAAVQFHAYFKRGMEVGNKAMERLEEQLDTLTPPQLIQVAKIGQQLSQVQAGIWARGQRFDVEDDDAMSGFVDDEDDVSPRFGGVRVRKVEGERRPVRDEGPADRARHNARAREEGGPMLPET